MAITYTAGTSVESTASVTSTTVQLPSGLADGDYTIIVVSLNVSSGGITTPSGWTDILASTASVNGSTSDKLAIFYRKWVSGDTDPVITTASGRVAATPIKVSGADGATFIDTAAVVEQAASGATTLTAPSITPTGTNFVAVYNGRNASGGQIITPFTNLSGAQTKVGEASARSTSTNAGHCFAVETVTAGAATGTRTADPNVTTTGAMAVSFALNEAAAGGGSQTAEPTGVATSAAVGTPTLSTQATVSPTGVADSGGVGTPTVSTTVTVSPTGIPSALGLGSPTLSSAVTVSPSGIASAAALGTPALSGSTSVTPDGIAGESAVGTPAASSSTTVSPTGIPSAAAVGTPALSEPGSDTQTVSPTGIPSASAVGTPTLAASTTVQPGGIASAQALGSPALSAPTTVQPTGIPTAAAVGTPSLSFPGPSPSQTVQPEGIPSKAAAGAPAITYWTVLRPTGIPSKAFVGQPVMLTSVRVTPTGVPSGVAFGQPTMSGPGAGIFHLDLEASIPKPNFKASITPLDRAAGLQSKRWKGHLG